MKPYRLRIVKGGESYTYFIRTPDGHTSYFSGSEVPLALSNLTGDEAALTRFKLIDAFDGETAAKVLQEVLNKQWRNNMKLCPRVEVI